MERMEERAFALVEVLKGKGVDYLREASRQFHIPNAKTMPLDELAARIADAMVRSPETWSLTPRETFEAMRDFADRVTLFARAAAVLYGVVTFEEVEELIARYWWDDASRPPRDLVRDVLANRRDKLFFVWKGYVCHVAFDCGRDTSAAVEDFLARRDGKPRWYPADRDALLSFFDDDDLIGCDGSRARELDAWLEAHGALDEDARLDIIDETAMHLQKNTLTDDGLEAILSHCAYVTDADLPSFARVFEDFANNLRLRVNNGHTANEYAKIARREAPPSSPTPRTADADPSAM